jgi:hypothetical protein
MFRALLICTVASASVAACTTTHPPQDARTTNAAQPCPPVTASRIPARPGECSSSAGRSYSQDDIQRTGQTNLADALPMLDPSITHH